MARNHSDDFSDDDPGNGSHSGGSTHSPAMYSTSSPSPDTHGSLGANGLTGADMDLSGMGESMISESGEAGRPTPPATKPTASPAQEAARAAQRSATTTSTRSTGGSDAPSPTSMARKKGNQPR